MREETIRYFVDEEEFKSYAVYPDHAQAKYPVVLIAPTWKGLDNFAREKARELAKLGYIGFAVDMYGQGKEAKTEEEATQLMLALFKDRALLQKRMKAAYETICQYPDVDTSKVMGIGFCFGGLAIIELLRSGVDVKGVVSFHGVLGNQKGDLKAKTVPIADNIKGALLILHGHDDPLVSLEDISAIQKEMTNAKVDWQMHIYGHTSHAFTDPRAHDKQKGLMYNPKTNERAWREMRDFFNELLSKG